MEKHRYYDKTQQRKMIFSIKMAEYLLSKGHTIEEFENHRDAQGKLVFAFVNNNKLHYDIDEYVAQNKKR